MRTFIQNNCIIYTGYFIQRYCNRILNKNSLNIKKGIHEVTGITLMLC